MVKKTVLVLVAVLVALSAVHLAYALEAVNLIKNSSFEEESGGKPASWDTWAWKKDPGTTEYKLEKGGGHSGNNFISITNHSENDARYKQTVKVEEGVTYKLSCWIKTENVGNGFGANMGLEGRGDASTDIKGTNGKWEFLEWYIVVGGKIDTLTVTFGLGGYGSMNTGKASFDDFTMEQIFTPPAGVTASLIIPPSDVVQASQGSQTAAGNAGTGQAQKGMSKVMWIALGGGVAIILVILALVIISRRRGGDTGIEIEEEEEPGAEEAAAQEQAPGGTAKAKQAADEDEEEEEQEDSF